MSLPVVFGLVVFVCVLGGGLLGMFLRIVLPERHLGAESRDLVRLTMGLLATMSALVVSLLITTAKTAYDTQGGEFRRMSAEVVLLDRVLAHYGPEAKAARELLRHNVADVLERMGSAAGLQAAPPHPSEQSAGVYDVIVRLVPQGDVQRTLRAEALRLAADIGLMRWLMFAQRGSTIPAPFLVILAAWFTILFGGFGLFARFDATVLATILVCALSLAAAVFLVLELDQPFQGVITISSTPLREALLQLGR
jgi:hypothetical protein